MTNVENGIITADDATISPDQTSVEVIIDEGSLLTCHDTKRTKLEIVDATEEILGTSDSLGNLVMLCSQIDYFNAGINILHSFKGLSFFIELCGVQH